MNIKFSIQKRLSENNFYGFIFNKYEWSFYKNGVFLLVNLIPSAKGTNNIVSKLKGAECFISSPEVEFLNAIINFSQYRYKFTLYLKLPEFLIYS